MSALIYFGIKENIVEKASDIIKEKLKSLHIEGMYDEIMHDAADHVDELVQIDGLQTQSSYKFTETIVKEMFESAGMFIKEARPNEQIEFTIDEPGFKYSITTA